MNHWKPDLFDAYGGGRRPCDEPRETQCNRCGSADVRWRQQGGRWVLFSLTPGVEHRCAIDTSGFGAVPE